MKKMLILISLLAMAGLVSAATSVSLDVSADADIRQVSPDTAYGIRTDMVAATSTDSAKIYMRFNLPADIGSVTSATLKVVRTRVASATSNLYYDVYGLGDAVAGQDWGETGGYVNFPATVQDGLTWNNAPANGASNTFTADATNLGFFMLPKGDDGGAVGTVHDFTGQGLIDFLNTDTDDVVNLMLSRQNTTSAWESFAGKENATYAGAVLEITYEQDLSVKTVELIPVADTDIRQDAATYAKGNRVESVAQNSAGKTKKIYIKYQLPSDFDVALSADFKIVPIVNYNILWNWEYNIFGLNDDAAGNDWPESSPGEIPGQPYTDGVTWENAPGNDSSTGAMTADVSGVLNSFNVFNELNVDVVCPSSQAIVDFVNTDTDGFITLIVTRVNSSTALDQFAARENTTYAGPRLVLSYETLPIQTVTLTATADTDIRAAAPDYAHSTRLGMWVSSYSGNAIKGYAKFVIPSDIGEVLSAELTYHRDVAGAWNSTYDVYGLKDYVVGNDWVQANSARNPGDPYTMGLTWNNAPGNDIASYTTFDTVDATGILGSFIVDGSSYGGVAGDSYSVSTIGLTGFIEGDSDGAVTLMISRNSGDSTSMDVFGAIETAAPAELTISYLPSCGVKLRSDINYDCSVDLYDYANMAGSWLETDPNFIAETVDVYPDDQIDAQDLLIVAQSWLACTLPGDAGCDQYWKSEYLAPARYDAWRKSWDTFPLAAWAYFLRYEGSVAEYQVYEQAGLTMVQTTPDQYDNAVAAGLYTLLGTWDALYNDLNKLETFMNTPTATESNLRGIMLLDDMRDYHIDQLKEPTEIVLRDDIRGAIPMVNLLPAWGDLDKDSGTTHTYQDYLDYVDNYINTVNPAILNCAYYSLMADGSDRAGTYDHLELFRQKAQANGIGFMSFVIVNEHLDYRSPSESDLNWKVWSSLAYGSTGIWYYNWRIEPDSTFGEGLITHSTGTPTSAYAMTQALNADIQAMGSTLLSFESTGVYHADATDPDNASITLYQNGDVSAMASFTGTEFILGEFANQDDLADTADYVMVVNKRHAADKTSAELTATADFTVDVAVTAVYSFDTATQAFVPLAGSGGSYSVSIDGGKAILLKFVY